MKSQLYESVNNILSESMNEIIEGLYRGAHLIFTNDFFEVALGISFAIIGYMIAFRRIKDEEIAHKIVWTLMIFSLVYTVLYDKDWYNFLIEVLNLPMEAFVSMIKSIVTSVDDEATISNIINRIHLANTSLVNALLDKGSVTNPIPALYGFVVWLTGSFLIIVILINGVFSLFLSQVVLALAPLVLPFLIWKKTEYIFFNWAKLYISVSLYAPFTLLFGLISIKVADLTLKTLTIVQHDFVEGIVFLASLIIVQLLVALGIFKIPNLINQIIGSSNEGSSLTSGVGTISAGGAIMGAFSKYTGMKFAGNKIGAQASKAGRAIGNKAMDGAKKGLDSMKNIKMR